MFSDIYYKAFYFWANWVACPLGAVPFQLDEKRRRIFTNNRSHRKSLRVWMFLAVNNLYLIWCLWHLKKTKNFNAFNQTYAGWVISSIWVITLGSFTLQPDLVCYLFNATVTFFDRYQKSYMPRYNPNRCPVNRVVDISCTLLRWSCFLIGVLETVHFAKFARECPFYINYYIPDAFYDKPVIIWTALFHGSIYFVTSLSLGFSSTFMVSITLHMTHIVSDDIRCGRKQKYRTLHTLRTGYNMQITYRSLQLLNKLYLEHGSMMLYPMNWLVLKMVTFLGATLIKYGHQMEPIVRYIVAGWVIFGIVMWGTCLELAGHMFLYSCRALTSWKYHYWGKETRVMAKFKRSCKPLKLAHRTMFSIKRLTVLKFFRSVGKTMFKIFVAL